MLLLLAWVFVSATDLNTHPIIGVLSQPTDDPLTFFGSEYIAASYVKWLESAGARVVPILTMSTPNMSDIVTLVRSLNGIVFPGGAADFSGRYWDVLTTVFKTALQSYDERTPIPLWGTCLGFQELSALVADPSVVECGLDSEDVAMPLLLYPEANQSRLFQAAPEIIRKLLVDATKNVTYNNHQCGVSLQTFRHSAKLSSFFDVLSHNLDRAGIDFVSTFEAKNYPIYGTQWHPEKAMFEWPQNTQINHDTFSVLANQWTAQYFVSECRKSPNSFPNPEVEHERLIYNYTPTYTGDISSFEQCYFF